MIKIYKNNGFIYINNDNKIELNSLIIKNYSLYKDKKTLGEIMNISKKQYYEKLGCNYSLT
jgi:CMP-N-acetylneuraminic acid synthetase